MSREEPMDADPGVAPRPSLPPPPLSAVVRSPEFPTPANVVQAERGRQLLKSAVRASIMDHLFRRRGVSLSQLCRERSLGWGTVQHHVHLLERAGLIYSVSHGRNRLYFHPSIDRSAGVVLAHLANRLSAGLAQSIVENPGITQHKLCDLLHITRKAFRHRMNELVRAGLVSEERCERKRLYSPTDLLRAFLAENQ